MCGKMKNSYKHIKKLIIYVICIQLMYVNTPIKFLDQFISKSQFLLQTSSNNDSSKKNSDNETSFPISENESKEDDENFSLKFFACSSKPLVFIKLRDVNFLSHNSKDKIQFHPEFSTPPPKYNAC